MFDYEFKTQYKRPRMTLCNLNKQVVSVLTSKEKGAYDVTLTETENEINTLSFSIEVDNGKIIDSSCEMLVNFEGEYYIIKNIDISSDNKVLTVSCVHEADELKGCPSLPIEEIGVDPQTMFNKIIQASEVPIGNYIWGGTDITDARRSLINDADSDDIVSVFENLVSMAEVFECALEFKTNTQGNIEVYFIQNEVDNGKYVRKGKGLKNLNISFNTDEIFTRLRAFGGENELGFKISLLDSTLNTTGQSYIENYDYYIAKGLSLQDIKSKAKCMQMKYWEDSDITDADTLWYRANEELKKASQPVIDGTIDILDISVLDGYLSLPPKKGETITVIDQDINYSIKSRITSITRNYDNPHEISVTISNVRRFDSIIRDLIYSSTVIKKVTTKKDGSTHISADFLKGKIDALKTSFGTMVENATQMNDTAILFSNKIANDVNFGGVALGTRGLMLSTTLDSEDEWVWETCISSKGIIADFLVSGLISSKDGSSWLSLDDGYFNFKDRLIFDQQGFRLFLENGYTVEQQINKTVTDEISKLGLDEIEAAILDGVLSSAEKKLFKNILDDISKEHTLFHTQYTILVNSLTGVDQTNFISKFNAYNTAYDGLMVVLNRIVAYAEGETISQADRTEYESKKTIYLTAIDNFVKAVEDVRKININTTITNEIARLGLDDLDSAFFDGLLTKAEIKSIRETLENIKRDYNNLDSQYTVLLSKLLGADYDSFVAKRTIFVNAYNGLVAILNKIIGYESTGVIPSEDRATYTTKKTEYLTALTTFTQDIENVRNGIVTQTINTELTIRGLNDLDSAFFDGLLTKSEKEVLKQVISDITKESGTIKVQFDTLYAKLPAGADKTNFSINHNAYLTSFNNLISILNTIINSTDDTISQNDRDIYTSRKTIYIDKLKIVLTNIESVRDLLTVKIISSELTSKGLDKINMALIDGVVTKAEIEIFKGIVNDIITESNNTISQYNVVYAQLVDATQKSTLKGLYDKYILAYNELSTILQTLISYTGDTQISDEDKALYETKRNAYITNIKSFIQGIENARVQVISQSITNEFTTRGLLALDKAFLDGMLTKAEAEVLKQVLVDIAREREGLLSQYNLILPQLNTANANTLTSYYTTYNTKYNDLVTIVNKLIGYAGQATIPPVDRATYETKKSEHVVAIKNFITALENARGIVMNGYISTEFINRGLANLNSAFLDNMLTKAEVDVLKTFLNDLNVEYSNLKKQYDRLYAQLPVAYKSELQTAYNGYDTGYINLKAIVTKMMGYIDSAIPPADKVTYETMKTNYLNVLTAFIDAIEVARTRIISNAILTELTNKGLDNIDQSIADGVLNGSEKEVFKSAVEDIGVEYAVNYDLIQNLLTNSNITSDINNEVYTNLSNALKSYQTAYTNLTNILNTMINADTITTEMRDTYYVNKNIYKLELQTVRVNMDKAILTINNNYTDVQIKITAEGIKGSMSETFVTNIDLAANYLTKEQIDAIKNATDEELITIKKTLDEFSLTAEGLNLSFSTFLEEGAKLLKNQMFQINDDGMTIASKLDEFSMNLDNTGMELFAYDTRIAKYDKDGAILPTLKVENTMELGNLLITKVQVNGVNKTHIHFIG